MWTALLYNSYVSTTKNVFATDGANRKRIEGSDVYEWGIAAPTVAPVIIAGPLTGLTGVYNVKYTYCRKEGTTVVCESNPSPTALSAVTLADTSLFVTCAAPTDSQITHIRLYRTLVGGAIYYHDQDIPVSIAYGYTHPWEAVDAYISGTGTKVTTTDDTNSSENTTSWEETYSGSDNTDYVSYDTALIGDSIIYTNTADLSLGAEVETDHDRPPLLITHLSGPTYNGTLFAIVGNLVYFCKPKQPEYWPTTYFIEASQIQFPGQLVVFHNGQPFYNTKHKIFLISGTGYDTFFPLPMESVTGAQGPKAAVSVFGHGIFHIGSDGIYLYANTDSNVTQAQFQPIFRGIATNGMPGAGCLECSWLIQFHNKLYFGYPISHGQYAYCHDWELENADTEEGYFGGTGYHFTNPDVAQGTENAQSWEADTSVTTYDYDTNSTGPEDRHPKDMLVFNVDNQRTSYYTHPYELRTVAIDHENDRLIAADTAGYVWQIEDPTMEDDEGTDIAWEVQSKDFTLQTRAHFPRWVKYDVDASDTSCVATGELIMDGVSHQSHTITGDRTTKRRLVATGNGRRVSVKISGTGPVEIYAAEGE